MHLPDGFLSLPVATATTAAVVLGGSVLCRSLRSDGVVPVSHRALLAGFVLAAQMTNFPVLPGVSGHMMGATLAAILLGPVAATVTLAGVLTFQCFVLHDGGISALGANLLNMAVAGVWSGWVAYRLAGGEKRPLLATALAGWVSVMMGTIFCSIELVLSSTAPASLIFPAMVGAHAVIGLAEGLLSAVVVTMLRPNVDASASPAWGRQAWCTLFGLAFLAALLAPFSCDLPDGLESVLQIIGRVR